MYPFSIRVYVYTRPNLRNDEMVSCVGKGFLERLFDTDEEIKDTEIKLIYPERYLNIPERRALFPAIAIRCKNMRNVEIVTHSVILISETPNGSMFKLDDPEEYPSIKYKRGVRYCKLPDGNNERSLELYYKL